MKDHAPLPPPDQADALATSLRTVISKLKRAMRAQAGRGDLSTTQALVLLRLEREGSGSVSELARAEGIRTQSMGTAIAPLETMGFIAGTPDPADGRRTILRLTDAGRSWIERARSARQDWLSKTLRARLSPAEQAQLTSAVALLERLVDE
ncbi:MarR family transcriptional regulator [Burkholderia sp. 3C]